MVVAVGFFCSLGLFLLVGRFSSQHLHQVLRANCLGTQTFGIGTGMHLPKCVFMQDVVVADSCKIIAADSLSDASLCSDTTFGPAAKNQFCTHGGNWYSVWTFPYSNLRPDIGW